MATRFVLPIGARSVRPAERWMSAVWTSSTSSMCHVLGCAAQRYVLVALWSLLLSLLIAAQSIPYTHPTRHASGGRIIHLYSGKSNSKIAPLTERLGFSIANKTHRIFKQMILHCDICLIRRLLDRRTCCPLCCISYQAQVHQITVFYYDAIRKESVLRYPTLASSVSQDGC